MNTKSRSMLLFSGAQLMELTTSDKLILPGILYEPKKKTKKVLINLHGNGSASVFYSISRSAAASSIYNQAGMAYLAFNNRGSGLVTKIKKIVGRKIKKVWAGTGYELIKDCVQDIDAAIAFLRNRGYREFYLMGFSTGANKICVYHYLKPRNGVKKYILAAGGDDMGIYYQTLGRKKFVATVARAKREIKQGNRMKLVPPEIFGELFSWQSFYDITNPDGLYNTFPYLEHFQRIKLAKKKLFREFQSIDKPTLVVYGERDEYCYGRVPEIMELLQAQTSVPKKFKFAVIRDADHDFTGRESEFNRLVANWLRGD